MSVCFCAVNILFGVAAAAFSALGVVVGVRLKEKALPATLNSVFVGFGGIFMIVLNIHDMVRDVKQSQKYHTFASLIKKIGMGYLEGKDVRMDALLLQSMVQLEEMKRSKSNWASLKCTKT